MPIGAFPRMNSGIPGLDELIEGGFPFPSVILVAGPAGAGKTTLAHEFLLAGAEKGEKGLFFSTLSEPVQWMLRHASQFDFVKPEHYGKEVVYCDLSHMMKKGLGCGLLDFMDRKIAEVMPQRIVLDPVTVLGTPSKVDFRTFVFDLATTLKNWQATCVLTGEIRPDELYPADITYVADGVILLTISNEDGSRRKYLEVLKMRGTNHVTGRHSMSITRKDGVTVLKTSQ